jgi:hypothetical protein
MPTMSRLKYLNPLRIRNAVREVRRSTAGGGPRYVRLLGLSQPQGLVIPVAIATIEIESRDGRLERFQPAIPVPFPYAWTYRLARALHLPLVRSLDPERIRFQVPVPGRGGSEDEPDESIEDAASPADRVTSAEEEAEDRSRDERAEVLQEEAERLEEEGERADPDDAEELRQQTERARAERRTVERG